MNRRTIFFSVVAILAPTWLAPAQDQGAGKQSSDAYVTEILPLLQRYCHDCHTGDEAEAEIDLSAFATIDDLRQQPKLWQKVDAMLTSRQMPPKDADHPSDVERLRMEQWVRGFLTREAEAHAGDPGPVVLRRLSNAEYTYTVRDLTGVESLDPTREFPIDGAAGEGFTNTGDALVMSPSLVTKYLDAAKGIAQHAVLLHDGIRFSEHTSRRDWTDETLNRIRDFYRTFTAAGGGTSVNLQGIQFDTNQGGLLPLEEYLLATIAERDALSQGQKSIDEVARQRGLNAKYLGNLWRSLNSAAPEQSFLMDRIRSRWQTATAENVDAVVSEIRTWQKKLWKFNTIGHIDRPGGPTAWMEPAAALTDTQEFRLPIPESADRDDVTVYLAAGSAGDGDDGDLAVWKNARLEGDDRPPLFLRDVPGLRQRMAAWRQTQLAETARYLDVAAVAGPSPDAGQLANEHNLNAELLKSWLNYLAIGNQTVEVSGHFEQKMTSIADNPYITGWGSNATPLTVANASEQTVNIPGTVKPHTIVAHPSPTVFAAFGWRSPIDGVVRVEAHVADAHVGCGNGQEWVVQHRTRKQVGNLGHGDFGTGGQATMPAQTVSVRQGDLISLILGPRQGNHSCDLTEVNLVITEVKGEQRVWDLTEDVHKDFLASNPHDDSHGNQDTWHFYTGSVDEAFRNLSAPGSIPAGSLLAQWNEEQEADRRRALARQIQALAVGEVAVEEGTPDAVLYEQLQGLVVDIDYQSFVDGVVPDPRFGRHPKGMEVESTDVVLAAPHVLELRVPRELANRRTFVVSGQLDKTHGKSGSVQLQVALQKPDEIQDVSPDLPFVAAADGEASGRLTAAFAEFRELFPIALCYERIVPIDEVVTLTLYYRQDEQLKRLMLDEQQAAYLDQLWEQLLFVAQEPLAYLVAFEQIREFSTQDRPDLVKAWNVIAEQVSARVNAFRKRLLDTEPVHVQAVIDFAQRAWRRPLTTTEQERLRDTYATLRRSEIDHEDGIRLTLARVLTAPAFLYRLEKPGPGKTATPVSNSELANRLSYFLWSSLPDDELLRVATSGALTDESALLSQTRRMLRDDPIRRMAIHFACQWLHVRGFDRNDEKNEKLYPEFAALRGEMYEETVQFFTDMFRNDGSILDLFNADHTFLNEMLAKHYGVDGVEGSTWRRVEGIRDQGRGGILAMATVLASQSGASRTSPILRGNWVSETLLGERLPRPPPNVPQLPEAVPTGLTARQLIEQHTSVPECAKCHARIDPYGFALEQYDAIGRRRQNQVDTTTTLLDGQSIEGIAELRDYLVTDRREDVLHQFCRKLLGYALGREVQLSDQPLLTEMKSKLAANEYRFQVAVEEIVKSRQFREVRGIGY